MDLLAVSGSPLFVSCRNEDISEEQKEEIKKAFKINSVQKNDIEPLDWEYNVTPHTWLVDGKTMEFDWVKEEYPDLLFGTSHKMV